MNDMRREQLKESMQSTFEQTLEERVDRYLAVNHQLLTAYHHFSHASAECIDLYRDGYFTACIMETQAVGDGVLKFVGDRNGIPQHAKESKQDWARRLQQAGVVLPAFVDAFTHIQGRYRNDFHHMNPPVATVNLEELARRNICDLATMEREIFECESGPEGTLILTHRQYWDIAADDRVPVYIRMG